jgi:hypothetical protein
MHRIERITQKQDIFIYILCYYQYLERKNNKGELEKKKYFIKEESVFLTTMARKVKDANKLLLEIIKKNSEDAPKLKRLPNIEILDNIETFERDLSNLLLINHSKRTGIQEEYKKKYGMPIGITENNIASEISKYHQMSELLLNFPWRIDTPEIKSILIEYYSRLLNGNGGEIIQEKIRKYKFIPKQFDKKDIYDSNYPFLFLSDANFKIYLNAMNINESIRIIFTLGKRKNGLYHIISPQEYNFNTLNELLNYMASININNISTIITDSNTKIRIFAEYKYKPQYILSLSSFINYMIYSQNNISINNVLQKIEAMLIQKNKENALRYIEEYIINAAGSELVLFKKIKDSFFNITSLYNYSLQIRPIISTNNIIDIISIIINILLANPYFCKFQNKEEAIKYIAKASNVIINNGHDMIPNWNYLTRSVHSI